MMCSVLFALAVAVADCGKTPIELEATPATFSERLDEAFRLRRSGMRPITLTLAPGDYPVTRTFAFTPQTCGSTGATLTVCGKFGLPRPRFLGSVPLAGWRRETFDGRIAAWTADAAALGLGEKRPDLLFFDGVRMDEARYPNRDPNRPYDGGWAYVPGKYVSMYRAIAGEVCDVVKIAEADWHAWADPSEGRLNIFPRYNWWNRWEQIADVVASNRTLVLARKMPQPARPCDRYHTLGFREELDAPGEWYYDRRAKRFWFIPPAGADPNGKPVTVPVCPWTFACARVCDVRFENLEIAAAQGGFTLTDCTNVTVCGCAVHDTGTFSQGGVSVRGGFRCAVTDCDIWNIAGNGVAVTGGDNRRMTRAEHLVENCYLHHCGQFNRHAFGVNMSGLGIIVRHNLIHDMPRCGIFHSNGRFNEISYNHVRHVNLEMEDTGAIYNCSSLTGTGCEIKYNHVSHSIGFGHVDQRYGFGHTACGIYLDDGSGGYRVYGNFVHDCRHVGMHLHCARFSIVSNNIFVANAPTDSARYAQFNLSGWKTKGGYEGQRKHMDPAWRRLVAGNPAWTNYPALRVHPDEQLLPDGHLLQGDEVVNNIFYYPGQTNTRYLTARNFNATTNLVDRNVIFGSQRLGVSYLTNDVHTAADWRAWGMDVHSVFADPLFADPAHGDWTLRPESPALKLGFHPLPYDRMGLRRSRYRPTLPIREAEGVREHPEWIGANR